MKMLLDEGQQYFLLLVLKINGKLLFILCKSYICRFEFSTKLVKISFFQYEANFQLLQMTVWNEQEVAGAFFHLKSSAQVNGK